MGMHMSEWTQLRIVHGMIAFLIACIGSVAVAWAALWGSMMWFGHLYPHDGQNGLGALFVGIIALPVSWVLLFFAVFTWLGVRLRKRLELERLQEAEPHFTITGKPV